MLHFARKKFTFLLTILSCRTIFQDLSNLDHQQPFIFDISLYDAYHYINLHSHRPIPRNDFKNLKHPLFQRLRLPGGKST